MTGYTKGFNKCSDISNIINDANVKELNNVIDNLKNNNL